MRSNIAKEVNIVKGLRKYRLLAGFTRMRLAELLGVNLTTIAKWETCKSYPPAGKLPAIAKLLSCSIDELFTAPEESA